MSRNETLHRDGQAARPLKRELVTLLKIIGEVAEEERMHAACRTPAQRAPAAPRAPSRPPAASAPRLPPAAPLLRARNDAPPATKRPAPPSPRSAQHLSPKPPRQAEGAAHEPFIVRARLVARRVPRRADSPPAGTGRLRRHATQQAMAPGLLSEFRQVFAFLGRSFAIPELAAGIERLAASFKRAPGFLAWVIGIHEPARPVRRQTAPRSARVA